MREVQIEDLLGRRRSSWTTAGPRFVQGKTVMVTGGAGSIGAELCRQIAGCQPRRLVVVDIAENAVYDLQNDLLHRHGDGLKLAVEIASVRELEKMDQLFRKYRPELVFHAAAHKHVPLMEQCPRRP